MMATSIKPPFKPKCMHSMWAIARYNKERFMLQRLPFIINTILDIVGTKLNSMPKLNNVREFRKNSNKQKNEKLIDFDIVD